MKHLITLAFFLILAANAGAQAFGKLSTITNLPATIATASSNITSGAITIRPGSGLSLWPLLAGTNSTTTNRVWFGIYGTPDGTNWSTSPVLEMWAFPPISGGGRVPTNFPASLVDNYYKVRIQQITNANAASVFLTNIIYFYHY